MLRFDVVTSSILDGLNPYRSDLNYYRAVFGYKAMQHSLVPQTVPNLKGLIEKFCPINWNNSRVHIVCQCLERRNSKHESSVERNR